MQFLMGLHPLILIYMPCHMYLKGSDIYNLVSYLMHRMWNLKVPHEKNDKIVNTFFTA